MKQKRYRTALLCSLAVAFVRVGVWRGEPLRTYHAESPMCFLAVILLTPAAVRWLEKPHPPNQEWI